MIRRWFAIFVIAFAAHATALAYASDAGADAAQALFVRSDIPEAERLAGQTLSASPTSMTANFVLMETAALIGDEETMLNSAFAICQADSSGSSTYARIAAGRIRSAASASNAFRSRIPNLRRLAGSGRDLPALNLALVAAASDGAPELSELQASRDSGLLTDWRIVGPFGSRPYIDFDHHWAPEHDGVGKSGYGGHKVEFFQFPDGQVRLPSYLAKDGVFYGSSQVYLRSGGDWRIFLESGGTLEVFIDGKRILLRDDRHAPRPQSLRGDLKLSRGDHLVMVKFLSAAAPFHLAIMAPTGGLRPHPQYSQRRYCRLWLRLRRVALLGR